MEAGDVETVIKNPKHPYTRLLIDSIPWPNLDQRWGEREIITREVAEVEGGCPFYGRCAQAVEHCKTPSPLYQIDKFQAASCYLYNDRPEVKAERLSEILPV